MIQTTVGQLLINESLPADLRDSTRVLDKKGLFALLEKLAIKYPDRYREVTKQLTDISREVATESGGNSFGLADMRRAQAAAKYRQQIRQQLRTIIDDDKLSDEQRNQKIITYLAKLQPEMVEAVLKESLDEDNPLAQQVISGARGNKVSLSSLRSSDVLYSDHRNQVIPLPVLRSYSEGLSPIEYWAGTYGARQGVMSTKFAVQEAGFLSKQLNQAAHRLVVLDEDDPDPQAAQELRGIPVDTDDMDNEGALLAMDVGGYKRNTPLTPKILKHLSRQGVKRILVRSPLTGRSPEGGLYARDVGVREGRRLPGRGEMVGLTAAQALSEPISQGQLNVRHTGGVAGQAKVASGFDLINSLVQGSRDFRGAAAHATVDGKVEKIEPAPAGGHYVTVAGQKHYVPQHVQVNVQVGQEIEAGDVLSTGIPQPGVIVEHKGIGEGRMYFAKALRQAMQDSNLKHHRRNIELLARGLVDHVRLKEEWADYVPDDVVSYSQFELQYKPRQGFQELSPDRATGKYLEKPVLHYTIGTKIRPSVVKELQHFGVKQIAVHDEPPIFQPEYIRGMANLQYDPDWMTRMYGSGLKTGLLKAVHRGSTSSETSTSFVPGLARGVDFGREGLVRPPEPGKLVPWDDEDDEEEAKKKSQSLAGPTVKASQWFAPLDLDQIRRRR
jgi:DNA-directed RNA polymerase subunit beta'